MARFKRGIQYSEAVKIISNGTAYWIARPSRAMTNFCAKGFAQPHLRPNSFSMSLSFNST
jgi:hypothetical protein